MSKLLMLRGVNPLFGVFMVNQLGIADRAERLQAMEAALEMAQKAGALMVTRLGTADVIPTRDEL